MDQLAMHRRLLGWLAPIATGIVAWMTGYLPNFISGGFSRIGGVVFQKVYELSGESKPGPEAKPGMEDVNQPDIEHEQGPDGVYIVYFVFNTPVMILLVVLILVLLALGWYWCVGQKARAPVRPVIVRVPMMIIMPVVNLTRGKKRESIDAAE